MLDAVPPPDESLDCLPRGAGRFGFGFSGGYHHSLIMAFSRYSCALWFALGVVAAVRADDNAITAAVKAADDARIAGMMAADRGQLEATLSDQLHYSHSVELTEDKVTHVAALVRRHLIYQSVDYKTREVRVVAPGVATMTGRALVKVGNERMIFRVDINFLAVWRLENNRWRLFAWQSSRNEEPVPLGPPQFDESVKR
jgi:hypothetical protein